MLFTSQQVALENARRSPHYLAHDSAPDSVTWVTSHEDMTDIAVPIPHDGSKPDSSACPAVFSLHCQIMPGMWFLDPDMAMNPDRLPQWQQDIGAQAAFAQGRGSCLTMPVSDLYPELQASYKPSINNIESIVQKALPRCEQSGFFVNDTKGNKSLKMMHHIYERRPPTMVDLSKKGKKVDRQARPGSPSDTEGITPIDELDSDVIPEFRIRNLPVSPKCRPLLENIVPTHRFNPLMAFEFGSERLIRPVEYGMKLRGAIVEMRFTLTHKIIKRPNGPTSHFTATIDEIIILGMPKEVPLAPSEQRNRRLFCIQGNEQQSASPESSSGAGPSTSTTKRNREEESDMTSDQEKQVPEPGPSTRPPKRTRK